MSFGRIAVRVGVVVVLAAGAAAATVDWRLIERKMSVPKTLPWPVATFQPQERVRGGTDPGLPVAADGRRSISDAALDEATAYAQRVGSRALLIWHNGAIQRAWYAPGTGPETILHTYHMQWVPLALLVGAAIADGHIRGPEQPAADFIPEWRGDDRAKITIGDLLQQSAGLELRFDAKDWFGRDSRAYWGSRTEDILVTYPATMPPQTQFDYNYIVAPLLGLIVERATGKRYADYLSEKLWAPLGNHDAFLWLNRPGGEVHLDAGLFSTASDWLHLGVMMLQDGSFGGHQLVPADWIKAMRTPSKTNPDFGYTWLGSPFNPARRLATNPRVTYTVQQSEPFAADDVWYADGYGGQRVYVVPSAGLVVVRIGDVARGEWDNAKLVNTLLREAAAPDAVPAAQR